MNSLNLPRPGLAWLWLAVSALGLSALFAIALILGRTPFGIPVLTFRSALVLHVDLSIVVWFLAFAAGIWSAVLRRGAILSWTGMGVAALGTLLMVVAPFIGGSPPVMVNYVPVLDSPLFHAGLLLFIIGILLVVLCVLCTRPPSADFLPGLAAWLGAAVALVASIQLLWAWVSLPSSAVLPPTLDETMWGASHVLQFVHVLLMLGVWHQLAADEAPGYAPPRLLAVLLWLVALPAMASLLIPLFHAPDSFAYRTAFTDLMRWASWPAALLWGGLLGWHLLQRWRTVGLSTVGKAALLSILLFVVGCLIGAAIRGDTLSVPAHYHGTVGAVTLAYLVMLRRQLESTGSGPAASIWLPRLPLIYGVGILLLVAGLAWWGEMGLPRKATHADLGEQGAVYYAAMMLVGIGGTLALFAILGTSMTEIFSVLRNLPKLRNRDVRPFAIILTLVTVGLGGWLLQAGGISSLVSGNRAVAHVAEKKRAEIESRFQQGVLMMHAKKPEYALAAFHRVLELAPEMPEAHVNTGFALLGMGKPEAALDFFESATQLNRNQINAYYGMAVAFEAVGNLRSAIEAMRAYLHRAPQDDPYRRKAEAALWEWESALKAKTGK